LRLMTPLPAHVVRSITGVERMKVECSSSDDGVNK
jgi:hypothetical protein